MVRIGLTGELGSGKSTVAAMLAKRGAIVLSSDDMGRALMEPGARAYEPIVAAFGSTVVAADGSLDRRALARFAFEDKRVEELNAIVHPAVLAEQAAVIEELRATQPNAIVVVESALLFSTKHAGAAGWEKRFDRIVLVSAPEAAKLERFLARMADGRTLSSDERTALTEDARRRMAAQRLTPAQAEECIVLRNSGDVSALSARVDELWRMLVRLRDVS